MLLVNLAPLAFEKLALLGNAVAGAQPRPTGLQLLDQAYLPLYLVLYFYVFEMQLYVSVYLSVYLYFSDKWAPRQVCN